jgi:tRNA(fMet)-specific endonuclease VapC
MLYMLDTDICSYIQRQHPIAVLETMQAKSEAGHVLCISVITYAELRLGAARSSNKHKYDLLISEFCERLDSIQSWDSRAADHFAELQAVLLRKGTPIGANDGMIAAHALSIEATLVTNNQKHFSKVPDLKLNNWVNPTNEH